MKQVESNIILSNPGTVGKTKVSTATDLKHSYILFDNMEHIYANKKGAKRDKNQKNKSLNVNMPNMSPGTTLYSPQT